MAQGNSDLSFNLLNSAESLVPLEDRAILLQHRGLMLMMVGRMDEARGGQAVVRTGDEIVGFTAPCSTAAARPWFPVWPGSTTTRPPVP
jgi:hypothetical protein